MNEAITALVGFAGWTLVVGLIMVGNRFANSFGGSKIALNQFSPDGEDLPGFGRRVTRAHLNCLETLPVFAALVAAAGLSDQMAIMEGTVMFVLYARLCQSVVHMTSTAMGMVYLRGGLFGVQVVLLIFYARQMLF